MDQTKSFAIAPEHDELDRVDRLVVFHPTRTESPKLLTTNQLKDFNRDGYVKGVTIFSNSEMTEIRAEFDRLLEEALSAGGDSYSISSAHLKHSIAYDLLTDKRIVGYVRDLLGENVVGWGSHFFCKMPHDGKQVAWHQDGSYWPLTPTKTVTVWLAIDDADRENACMRFVPGSHLQGHIEFEESSGEEGNVLNQTVTDVSRFDDPVDDELRAGQISLHSDLLLHGSEANDSDRRRCGLTLRYCAADVRAYLDWNQKGIVVSGSDPSAHWANPPRPSIADPSQS